MSLLNSLEAVMQFTIEKRHLTTADSRRMATASDSLTTTVEARDSDEAINQYVSDNQSVLVSYVRPLRGSESIATVKKNDDVYMVRIYAN